MATINRTKFNGSIPAQEQSRIAKVIVANTTMRGYLHLVTVRTAIQNDKEVEVFMDILIHPDRAASIDVAKFDAVSLQGLTPRNPAGDVRDNTTYHWATGCKAVGKHLVEYGFREGTKERVTYLAGVGLYDMTQETEEKAAQETEQEMAMVEQEAS